jgi:hypoxia up-regulated 1
MKRSILVSVALFLCAITCISLCFFPAPVSSAVLGIDFGSEYIKLASVAPGQSFHIVVDEQSKRKVPAVVAFEGGERFFGNGATQFTAKKPISTYWFFHRLLGQSINSQAVKDLKAAYFPYNLVAIPDRNSIGVEHKGFDGNETIYTVEEVIAMSFHHLVKCAEVDNNGVVIKDVVLTVPEYFSQQQRQAILDAADLAGLNVLSLINENSAAAIQYGIDRKYDNETQPHTVVLYNMGSTSTKVSVARFSGYSVKGSGKNKNKVVGQVEILGTASDFNLGGAHFELVITNYIADEVNAQLKAKGQTEDIRKNARAMAKIRLSAEKAKNVLSANQDTPIYIPGLVADTDFKVHITRDKFYELAAGLLERVGKPIQSALAQARLTAEQIDNFLILGGSVRIPAVQTAIKQYLGRESLGQSLNGDEAMALGAVFRAANLSTAFQVRQFGFTDITLYPVGVKISDIGAADTAAHTIESVESSDNEDDEENSAESIAAPSSDDDKPFSKRTSLFKANNKLAKKKTVAFIHNRDFTVELFHEAAESLPADTNSQLLIYNVTGLSDAHTKERYAELLKAQKPKVSLSFLLDNSGIVSLVKAEATVDDQVKVYLPKEKVNATSTRNNSTDNNSTATESGTESSEAEKAGETSAKPAETKAEAKDASILSDEKGEYRLKKQLLHIPLRINALPVPGTVQAMNFFDKKEARARLSALKRADEQKKAIAQAKNTLEAHVYSSKHAINDGQMDPVSTDEQRTEILGDLAAIEDWIYEQSEETVALYADKLAQIKAKTEPLQVRFTELTERPQAINSSYSLFSYCRNQMADYASNRTWIKAEEREKLIKLVEEVEEWLKGQVARQGKLQPHENPAFLSTTLYDKLRPLAKLSQELSKIKKPIEKPKPKASSSKNNSTKANQTEANSADKSEEPAAAGSEEPATPPGSDDAQPKSGTETESAEKAAEEPKDEL